MLYVGGNTLCFIFTSLADLNSPEKCLIFSTVFSCCIFIKPIIY